VLGHERDRPGPAVRTITFREKRAPRAPLAMMPTLPQVVQRSSPFSRHGRRRDHPQLPPLGSALHREYWPIAPRCDGIVLEGG
jgi:hypothetical protein